MQTMSFSHSLLSSSASDFSHIFLSSILPHALPCTMSSQYTYRITDTSTYRAAVATFWCCILHPFCCAFEMKSKYYIMQKGAFDERTKQRKIYRERKRRKKEKWKRLLELVYTHPLSFMAHFIIVKLAHIWCVRKRTNWEQPDVTSTF